MFKTEVAEGPGTELSADAIREQLELLVQDHAFRSSKRSVQFLTYVVEQTLRGAADQIKERTIGVEVFGREPSYDTNLDHVVRTAAIELRKRLAIYYGDERHRSELRMSLVPGSYIPRFTLASQVPPTSHEAEAGSESAHFHFHVPAPGGESAPIPLDSVRPSMPAARNSRSLKLYAGCATVAVLLLLGTLSYDWFRPRSGQDLFWKPLLDTPGSVLLAVGDVPNGPPTSSTPEGDQGTAIPIVHKTSSPTVPFADAVTIARVLGVLESHGKKAVIRRESSSSFSDLREGPVVLIGAFNNEWSLRLTRQLRYTLALDADKHLVYIKDAKNPAVRNWSWSTDKSPDHQGAAGGPALQDYALISRIWNSETGHMVIVIGGLYTYGTEAAGEFLTDPQLMQAISKVAPMDNTHSNLQIVLGTTVTDDTPGPPRVLAVSAE
jgi:hypothetical protein